jgi:hypothetical protein
LLHQGEILVCFLYFPWSRSRYDGRRGSVSDQIHAQQVIWVFIGLSHSLELGLGADVSIEILD